MPPIFSVDDSQTGSLTSRRDLLLGLTVTPAAALVTSPWGDALKLLHDRYDDELIALVRTKERRRLSRFRYHNAETFYQSLDRRLYDRGDEMLYQSGIVAQLALSSHLLDIGFSDRWNARHIGLDIAKGLAYANASGFAHLCPDMARLAVILSPYWKWRHVHRFDQSRPDDGQFALGEVCEIMRALLDRVHDVTGHPRPNGWRNRPTKSRS